MTQQNRTVKIALITGYLGAGKTTLLNHILGNDQGIRAAVIVNDIGEVNVDAALIEKNGVVSQVTDTLVPLSNGCICCTLADDLARQLTQIAESGNFDYIIIEASGICEPIPIAFTIDNFCKQESARGLNIELDNIIAVVDCARMFDEFSGGKDLLEEDIDDEDIEALLIQQIEFCTTLVLNKTDVVTPEQVGELKALVRSLQKDAKIIEAVQGNVALDELLGTDRFDFNTAYESAAWMDAMEHPEEHEDPEVLEYDIETFVYERRKPFSMASLEKFAQTWPESIIRVKGLVWIADDPNMAYVLEQAGKQIHMQENGWFIASAPEEDFKKIVAENPEVLDDWDDECGDRMTKLVVIGRHMDKQELIDGLDACLVPWVH
jgi:G3E family GTPase